VAEELKGPPEPVVGLVGAVRAEGPVVVEEEGEALEDQVLPVDRLPLEAVVDVAEAQAECYDGVGGVEGQRAEEVVLFRCISMALFSLSCEEGGVSSLRGKNIRMA
jgi:hypothetical protein